MCGTSVLADLFRRRLQHRVGKIREERCVSSVHDVRLVHHLLFPILGPVLQFSLHPILPVPLPFKISSSGSTSLQRTPQRLELSFAIFLRSDRPCAFPRAVQSIYRFKFQRLATAALQEAEQHHSEGASGNSEGGNGNAEEPRSRAEETQSRAEEAGVEGREREDEDVENDNSQQRARSGRRDGEKKRRESGEG
eukprot:1518737-Rhodomonas_salina.1